MAGSNSSTHPSNQSSAFIDPRFSVSSKSTLTDQDPEGVTIPVRSFVPLKLDVKVRNILEIPPSKS